MIVLEQDNLKELLDSNKQVIVQYGAGWCGMCRMIKQQFESLSKENDGVTFIYADAEKFPGTREFAEVKNLPTFAGFKDGKLVTNKMGAKKEVIQEVLDAIASH